MNQRETTASRPPAIVCYCTPSANKRGHHLGKIQRSTNTRLTRTCLMQKVPDVILILCRSRHASLHIEKYGYNNIVIPRAQHLHCVLRRPCGWAALWRYTARESLTFAKSFVTHTCSLLAMDNKRNDKEMVMITKTRRSAIAMSVPFV